MKITLEITENDSGLEHQPWPWNIHLTYDPTRRTTSSYAYSLAEAFEKAAKYCKEDL